MGWHAAGGRVGVARDLRCVHDAGGTQTGAGTPTKSSLYYYFNCRNRLLFAAAHLPGRDRARWRRGAAGYARYRSVVHLDYAWNWAAMPR